jgi:hypothetical protein
MGPRPILHLQLRTLPMHIKAKWAMDKAEEFTRKKQMRQWMAILSAAEHRMQQKGGLGKGGHRRRGCRCVEDGKQCHLVCILSLDNILLAGAVKLQSTKKELGKGVSRGQSGV